MTTAFDPNLPGTDDAVWRSCFQKIEWWFPRPGPLLIVSPHPDDEVLGAGGLIKIWMERGNEVTVVSVTDGEAAFPDWIGLDKVRRNELDQALAILSPHRIGVIRLGLPDGKVDAKKGDLVRTLLELCVETPTLIAPFEADGHPDHDAVASACLSVARRLDLPIARYPIWAWHHRQPKIFAGKRWGKFPLDIRTRVAKTAAMNCFVSQLAPGDFRQPIVPKYVLEYFRRDYEAFFDMNEHPAVSQAAFEAKYRSSVDPWNFTGSTYERDRYAFTLRWLSRDRYRRAFEPACSVGVLTAALAERCDTVHAIDIAPTAVAIARERCANSPQVAITCADVRTHQPGLPFDLIVFSELGYYFTAPQLSRIGTRLCASLEPNGEFLAVHWLGTSNDHVLHGDEVHAVLIRTFAKRCEWIKGARQSGFRLDTWRRK